MPADTVPAHTVPAEAIPADTVLTHTVHSEQSSDYCLVTGKIETRGGLTES